MNPVKTYHQVNQANQSLSFGISRMEEIYEKREGQKDDPHRHDFYTVILVKNARGRHVIDFQEYTLGNSQIFFVSPGQVHQVLEFEKSFGYSILFSSQFLIENNVSCSFIENLKLFNAFEDTPPLFLADKGLDQLTGYAEEMLKTDQSEISFKYDALGSLLKLLLIHCNNLCTLGNENTPLIESGNSLLRNFKNLLNEKYNIWHGAAQYARKLSVTPDHLNRVVKLLTGKTTKEHIQSRIIVEAKRLIYFSSLSSKEIAYQLGFSEPANFSAFFKKWTGFSPSKFIKEQHVY